MFAHATPSAITSAITNAAASHPAGSPSAAPHPATLGWPDPLDAYETIGLTDLGAASLLERVETKYVFGLETLREILALLPSDYRALEIGGVWHPYRSLYFDTPDFSLFLRHHAGARGRYKLRSRTYGSTNTHVFEVKYKSNKGKTFKRRVTTADPVVSVDEVSAFLREAYPAPTTDLAPRLENRYTRITLVSRGGEERVTFDLGLEFSHAGAQVALPGLVIAEVKRGGRAVGSVFMQEMKRRRVFPRSLSKYCLGVSLLHPVKHNRFKPTLRHLATLTEVIRA